MFRLKGVGATRQVHSNSGRSNIPLHNIRMATLSDLCNRMLCNVSAALSNELQNVRFMFLCLIAGKLRKPTSMHLLS